MSPGKKNRSHNSNDLEFCKKHAPQVQESHKQCNREIKKNNNNNNNKKKKIYTYLEPKWGCSAVFVGNFWGPWG